MNIIETNLKFKSMSKRQSTDRLILHHSACSSCTAEQIHQWHLNNGWEGAGYHFLVRKDGQIYRLRPEEFVGAHAKGSNYNSIGICAEGNFENETMPEAQKNSLIELVSYLKGKYGISKVLKHSDVNNTACPGKNYPFNEIVNGKVEERHEVSGIIADIQSKLNSKYGYNIAIDNIYGVDTHKHMVMALQTEFNKQLGSKLVIDGIFGSATKRACPVLKNGMSGNITWLVQSMLLIKGYSVGNSSNDSIYGSGTISGVKSFQSKNSLVVDGLCGSNTFEKLFK
nr:MAG TPA: endodeoxyribonuclease I [Caudoviricetes sp.]